METANGVYAWGQLDRMLSQAQANNQTVLYTFGGIPSFLSSYASDAICAEGAGSCDPPNDVNPDGSGSDAQFQAFVSALMVHAGKQIQYFEAWTEVNNTPFWNGSAAQIVRMVYDARAIIKAYNPSAVVLTPSTCACDNVSFSNKKYASANVADGMRYYLEATANVAGTPSGASQADGIATQPCPRLPRSCGRYRKESSLPASPTPTSRARNPSREFKTRAFLSAAELIAQGVDAVSVAVPTVLHLPVARELMQSGVDVLIEKPLAASVSEADELITVAEAYGRIAQVGHLERFNPAVRATFPLLTQPMFFEVHRLSVFTPRSLDVDVVLDLMIHDIDIVLTFAKSKVKEIRAVGLPILSKKVDIANVRMEFESGCVANFTASRVSTERVRKLRFFQPRQYISLDYSRQDVLVLTMEDEAPDPLGMDPFNPASVAASALPGIVPFKPKVEQQEPLKAEISQLPQRRAPAFAARGDAAGRSRRLGDCHANRGSHRGAQRACSPGELSRTE